MEQMKAGVLVYISGPMTAKDGRTIEQNTADGVAVYLDLLKRGIPAFSPHLSGAFPSAWSALDHQQWIDYDCAIIDHCTHLLMMPRWETSKGAVMEFDYAQAKGIPVAESVEQLTALLAGAEAIRQQQADVCDACGGTGTPTSGLPCMCKGTGKMSEAARTLREQLFDVRAEAERSSPSGLAAYRPQHHDGCASRKCGHSLPGMVRTCGFSRGFTEIHYVGAPDSHAFVEQPCSCGLAALLSGEKET